MTSCSRCATARSSVAEYDLRTAARRNGVSCFVAIERSPTSHAGIARVSHVDPELACSPGVAARADSTLLVHGLGSRATAYSTTSNAVCTGFGESGLLVLVADL